MKENLIYFDSEDNPFYFNQFKKIIIRLKTFIKNYYIEKVRETFNYHDLLNKTFEDFHCCTRYQVDEDNDTPAIIFAIIRFILQNWFSNMISLCKMTLNPNLLNLILSDVFLITNDDDEFWSYDNFIYDGNEACDRGLHLQLIMHILNYIIYLMKKNFSDNENLIIFLNKFELTVRLGIIINISNEDFNELFLYRYNSTNHFYTFYVNLKYKYQHYETDFVNAFVSVKQIIHNNINIYFSWLLDLMIKILLTLNIINPFYPICPLIHNYFIIENCIEKIEAAYRVNFKEIKQIKENLISLSVSNYYKNKKIVSVTKRLKLKPRTRRCKNGQKF